MAVELDKEKGPQVCIHTHTHSFIDAISRKSLTVHRFKSDWDEIWQDCSSSKRTSIHRVEFSI